MLGQQHYILILCLTVLSIYSNAQDYVRCASTEYLNYQIQKNPDLKLKIDKAEEVLQQNVAEKRTAKTQTLSKRTGAIITIPVVVHVVYNDPADNISMNQIQSQINVLNQDYRMNNADSGQTPSMFQPLAADVEVEFCLAVEDPNGNFTDGVTRTQTSTTEFDVYMDDIKSNSTGGKTGWDRDRYLNIWVGEISGGVLGYATNPSQPASVDGVVVGVRFFGGPEFNTTPPYNLGRTTTHEVGHWLNLRHMWGNSGGCSDDDNVSDTPVSNEPYYACTPTNSVSCNTNDMYMNFMDYVPDACMHLFTIGQKDRMITAINTQRSSLLSSTACSGNALALDAAIEVQFETIVTCDSFYPLEIQIQNAGTTTLNSVQVEYSINGNAPSTSNINVNLSQGQSSIHSLGNILVQENNQITITVISVNGVADQNSNNSVVFQTIGSPLAAQAPLIEGFEDLDFEQDGWDVQNVTSDDFFWQRSTEYGDASSSSALYDNFSGEQDSNPDGTVDHIQTPALNFANASFGMMTFSRAYAVYNQDFFDGLRISYSLDCSETWQTLWFAEGAALATFPQDVTAGPYYPNDNEWETQNLNLNAVLGQSDVLFRFTNESGWGQILWLDNININTDGFTSINDDSFIKLNPTLNVSPNPSSNGIFNVQLADDNNVTANIQVFNANGSLISQYILNNEKSATLNLSNEANGLYLIKLVSEDFQLTKKVLLSQ